MGSHGTIALHSVITRSSEIIFTEIEDDVTMMDAQTGKYYWLPKVGARIWGLLSQPSSVAHICDCLLSEYRVERKRCEDEVLAVVQKMYDQGIVSQA